MQQSFHHSGSFWSAQFSCMWNYRSRVDELNQNQINRNKAHRKLQEIRTAETQQNSRSKVWRPTQHITCHFQNKNKSPVPWDRRSESFARTRRICLRTRATPAAGLRYHRVRRSRWSDCLATSSALRDCSVRPLSYMEIRMKRHAEKKNVTAGQTPR